MWDFVGFHIAANAEYRLCMNRFTTKMLEIESQIGKKNFVPLSGIFTMGEIFAMFNGFNSLFCVGIFELLCAFWRNATYYGIDNLCKITESASDQIYQPPPSPMLLLRCDCTLHITKIPCKLSNILNQNIYDFSLIQSNSTFGICIWLLDWNCFLILIFYWMGSI